MERSHRRQGGGPISTDRRPSASSADAVDSLGTRVQTTLVVVPGEEAESLERRYIQAVLARYLWLPDTPSQTSRHDRRLARTLCKRGVPLLAVETALLLGEARRVFRARDAEPLPSVRSLYYFLPVVAEVESGGDPDCGYSAYLLRKLRPLAERKRARLHRAARNGGG